MDAHSWFVQRSAVFVGNARHCWTVTRRWRLGNIGIVVWITMGSVVALRDSLKVWICEPGVDTQIETRAVVTIHTTLGKAYQYSGGLTSAWLGRAACCTACQQTLYSTLITILNSPMSAAGSRSMICPTTDIF
jgi:hypothetical protein